MDRNISYIKLMLKDIMEISDRTTSGNVSHNINTIKGDAKRALDCLDEYQKPSVNSFPEEPVSKDLEAAAEEYVKNHVTIFGDGSTDRGNRYLAFMAGAQWQKQLKNL